MNQQEMLDIIDYINREDNMNENLEVEVSDTAIKMSNFWSSVALKSLIAEAEPRNASVYFSGVTNKLIIH